MAGKTLGELGGISSPKELIINKILVDNRNFDQAKNQFEFNNITATTIALLENFVDPDTFFYKVGFPNYADLTLSIPSPDVGDLAFTRDTKTIYICDTAGVWTDYSFSSDIKAYVDNLIISLKGGVSVDGDTLKKLNDKISALELNKQDKTDNTLLTTNKTIVGAINENKTNIDLKANASTTYNKTEVDSFLNQKVNKTTTINNKDLSSNITLTKADFSDLNNVDNTTDLNKPISTATQNALDLKVDKISGKGLSTEDYTTAEKTKLAAIAAEATKNQTDAYLLNRTNHTGTQLASTVSDFQAAVSLNTDVAGNTSARHTHSNKTILDNTTASYTIAEANKLAGIQAGAEVNVNADWNSTTGDSQILNKPDLTLKKDRLNNALVRFVSSSGLTSNDGKDNDKPTTLQNAHDTINASGVIYLETGTYQNTWNQTPVQTTLLNITKSNITLVCQDFSNGSKADIRWRTWTANTVLKAGDIVADPDDVNSTDSAVRMNYRSWICNSNRTTGATWNSTEKAFFTENTTIPLIKLSSTLRGQIKGLTVRGKRAFTIENIPSSGAGVHSFEYCGDLNLYLKTAFYGQLIVDNGNLTLEYDSSLTVGATTTIDLSNLRYINLIKPKAITSVRSSQFIAVDSIAAQGSIFDIKNSRYINILSHTNGQLLIDSSTEIMNIISTANKLNVAGYDYNKIQITNSNFNYINVLNGQQSVGLLQKTGDCPHYIRNCIGLDVSQASFLNFALNGDSLVFPRANAINQSTIPSLTEDITKGWDLGSTWTLSTGTVYTCYSNAINNAVWASSDNILPEVADKATLESTYLIGFGNTTSYAGKYISVINANGLPITSGTISDGRTANYQIKVGTSGDTASQLTYKSSIAPVQVSGGGVQINDFVISSTSTYSSNKINTELATKENTITTLPIEKGGTNSSTALTNDKVIISEGGKFIESSTTKTQLSYLDATSSVQTQINSKANDSDVVKLTGNQTIDNDKTFNGKILVPNALLTSNVDSYLVIENNEIKKQILAIPDKHFGNSTDSRTITNSGSLTFAIETGLFFYPLQDVIVYHDNLNNMHGQIISYNSTMGEIVIDITSKTGSGTYSLWQIYYDGATSSNVNLVDNLTTQDANAALTANQGYILDQNKVNKTTTINGKALSSNVTINADEITEGSTNKFSTNSLVLSYVLTGVTTATTWAKLTGTNTIKQLADFANLIYDKVNEKFSKNAANEINTLTEKVILADNDIVLMEDSASSFNKRKSKFSSILSYITTKINADAWSWGNTHIFPKIGINTTNPQHPFHLVTSSNSGAYILNTGGDGNGLLILEQAFSTNPVYYHDLGVFRYNGSQCGSIALNTANSVNYNSTSDIRVKDNIVFTTYNLNDLLKIKVRDYTWKSDNSAKVHSGLIAQELFEIYPEAVTAGDQMVNENKEINKLWSIDYGKLTPLLIKSVQDLNEKVEQQAKEIAELKALIQSKL